MYSIHHLQSNVRVSSVVQTSFQYYQYMKVILIAFGPSLKNIQIDKAKLGKVRQERLECGQKFGVKRQGRIVYIELGQPALGKARLWKICLGKARLDLARLDKLRSDWARQYWAWSYWARSYWTRLCWAKPCWARLDQGRSDWARYCVRLQWARQDWTILLWARSNWTKFYLARQDLFCILEFYCKLRVFLLNTALSRTSNEIQTNTARGLQFVKGKRRPLRTCLTRKIDTQLQSLFFLI